ncbi:hypothetical protein [Amycolatopsis sp. 195334CR]|uniref:hypothetical protein n=1 Tax=Amycolatopsis sp. 195334CR TaxID=2814588 RepID=UPI001A8EAAC6|nr:hypothetical protein [Amycolatopsis sp. 195334CR]MBN6041406.1 hypothetical protein [Amycolatopsis sp. 195334CR]
MVGVGVVLLAGTACASPQNGSQPAAAPPPPAASAPADQIAPGEPQPAPPVSKVPGGAEPADPADPEAGTTIPEQKIDAAKLPEGFPKKVAMVADGKVLSIGAQEGGCGKASLEIKEQSAEKVVVNVVETEPGGNVACTMDIRYPTLTVELEQPLGERTVVLEHEQRKQ